MVSVLRGLTDIPPIMMWIFVTIHWIDIRGARAVIKERSGYNKNGGAIDAFQPSEKA